MDTTRRHRTPRRAESLAWKLLIYHVPTEPASKRVATWRDLKRLGALHLQQCVCILPDVPGVASEVELEAAKITAFGGDPFVLDVPRLQPEDEARIIETFRALLATEYSEIIEECQTKFVKQVQFEQFRQNYTFDALEAGAHHLGRLRRWHERVSERDWFKA